MSETRRQREPQPLSGEYHKARKELVLWAGILLIWSLIGVDLEKARETGGTVGAVVAAIKSPQAVPWVLIILVLYFLFKTNVEWLQCNLPRRNTAAAKVDFTSGWIVSLVAICLYVAQAVTQLQFADQIKYSARLQSYVYGLFLGVGGLAGFLTAIHVTERSFRKRWQRWLLTIASLVLFGGSPMLGTYLLFSRVKQLPFSYRYILFGIATMVFLYFGCRTLWRNVSPRFMQKTLTSESGSVST
jgi:hypothetical protein